MSTPENPGKVTADIAEELIQEALRSVEARERQEAPAPQPAAAEGAAQGTPAPEVAALTREVEELRAQLELSQAKGREMMEKLRDTHERMLRAAADLDNFKKRAAREKEEVQKFGIERVLKDLLPVMDNLERALLHAEGSADTEGFKTGVRMTARMFEENLGRHGVKAFSAKGQPFDPHVHEAMQQVETTEVAPNHVVSEVMRGYFLNERLIRPALVVVAREPAVPLPAPAAPSEAAAAQPATAAVPAPEATPPAPEAAPAAAAAGTTEEQS